MKKILVITDNEFLLKEFLLLISKKELTNFKFTFRYSFNNKNSIKLKNAKNDITPINVSKEVDQIIKQFTLVISLHCKQIFPSELVNKISCVNVHPGYNPYNRGWFPQVFSILNKLPFGATIHEIDEKLDHGKIICQKMVPLFLHDTSESAYNRVLKAEIELLEEYLEIIINGNYTPKIPIYEGNLNLKKDFQALCEINLEEKATYGQVIDRLRALTHGDYNNAYFIDDRGNKVYIKIKLVKENGE